MTPLTPRIGDCVQRKRWATMPRGRAMTSPMVTAQNVRMMCSRPAAYSVWPWRPTQSHQIHEPGPLAAKNPPVADTGRKASLGPGDTPRLSDEAVRLDGGRRCTEPRGRRRRHLRAGRALRMRQDDDHEDGQPA